MRQPKPFWKASHKCWYVKIKGIQHRLDPDEEKAWQLYYKMMAGTRLVGDSDPVVEVVDQFLDWSNLNHEPNTFQFYLIYNKSFCQLIPRNLKLRDLRPIHVTRWVDKHWPPQEVRNHHGEVITPAASNNTRRGAIRAVQRAFSWARKQKLIEVDPLEGIEKPKQTPRDVYLWPEQYRELLKLVKDQAFRDIMEVMRHTGCRPEEARKIEARWINWEDRCWEFPREVSKGKQKRRVVLLNNVAFSICRRVALTHPEGPILLNSRGGVWMQKALVDRCRRLRTKVSFYVCPYAIRHTFATDAILRGVDLVTIKELMGHANLRMLSEIYQHVEKRSDHLRKGLEKATGHLKPISSPDGDSSLRIVG